MLANIAEHRQLCQLYDIESILCYNNITFLLRKKEFLDGKGGDGSEQMANPSHVATLAVNKK